MKLPTIVPITDMRQRQRELLEELSEGPTVLTQHGRPVAVMIAPEQWNNMQEDLADLRDLVATLQTEEQIAAGEEELLTLDPETGEFVPNEQPVAS